jgi:hypothetical protein
MSYLVGQTVHTLLFSYKLSSLVSKAAKRLHGFWKLYEVLIRGDQIGLFKLVTLNCILNRITGVTLGC